LTGSIYVASLYQEEQRDQRKYVCLVMSLVTAHGMRPTRRAELQRKQNDAYNCRPSQTGTVAE
jgi:hypothetical protein